MDRPPKRRFFKAAELAYMAGFLDGEGCFSCVNGSTPRVSVTNTYPPVLKLLKNKFGGRLWKRSNKLLKQHRQAYNWQLDGVHAILAIRELIPYLKEKRKQAEILIKLWGNRTYYNSHPTTKNKLLKRLTALKHIEYKKAKYGKKYNFKKCYFNRVDE